MIDFVILSHTDPTQLAAEVKRFLYNGWEFHGEVFTVPGIFEGQFCTKICQAMVRDTQK